MKKSVIAVVVLGIVAAMTGCNKGTSGGPGASTPPKKDMIGQTEGTFSVTVPALNLNQGEAKTISVGIKRGQNFSEDVSLNFSPLPAGVTLDPENPSIKQSETEARVTLKASDTAALGNFTVNVTGHPTKGADAQSEMKLSVAQAGAADAGSTTAEAAKAKWEEYTAAMQKQWDEFAVKLAELQERAGKAEGQAKEELDKRAAEAKEKLDAAAVRLNELKEAGADRWEKVKEGASNAFEDLKTMFE